VIGGGGRSPLFEIPVSLIVPVPVRRSYSGYWCKPFETSLKFQKKVFYRFYTNRTWQSMENSIQNSTRPLMLTTPKMKYERVRALMTTNPNHPRDDYCNRRVKMTLQSSVYYIPTTGKEEAQSRGIEDRGRLLAA
jgi:hypothetical protein